MSRGGTVSTPILKASPTCRSVSVLKSNAASPETGTFLGIPAEVRRELQDVLVWLCTKPPCGWWGHGDPGSRYG